MLGSIYTDKVQCWNRKKYNIGIYVSQILKKNFIPDVAEVIVLAGASLTFALTFVEVTVNTIEHK